MLFYDNKNWTISFDVKKTNGVSLNIRNNFYYNDKFGFELFS